jgi:hypothetical protein
MRLARPIWILGRARAGEQVPLPNHPNDTLEG